MSDFYSGERNYESAYDPIVKLYLHEAQAEAYRLKVIDKLLDSLTPADNCELYSHRVRSYFNIATYKKKPK